MKLEYGFKQDRPPFECLWHKVAHDDNYAQYKTFSEESKCKSCKGFNDKCKAYTPIVKVFSAELDLETKLDDKVED